MAPPSCQSCSNTLTRPWPCLTCPFMGCFPLGQSSKNCTRSHWAKSDNDCNLGTCPPSLFPLGFWIDDLAFDPVTGAIYCGQCDDLVISDTFDELFLAYQTEAEEDQDESRDLKGRTRGRMKQWSPAPEEQKALVENFTKSSCRGKLFGPSIARHKLIRRCPTIIEPLANVFPIGNPTSPDC
jgi:ubiquitin carboxyl-terminal hydrolase 22/27/51